MSDSFFSWKNDTLQLRVYVQPKASRDEIVGRHGDYLKVRITAPPIEGKANAHLLKYLARVFGVGRDQIEITAGSKGRHKQPRIQDPSHLPNEISQAS
ncbi:MAG: DUF167 family protein [Gammaproteobacteria bacterium]|nr:DUF167 family protein [Gammaproteobacteria bacterium]